MNARFYVVSTMPGAAYKAIRGTLPARQVRRVALFSDGAARLVDRFRLIDWRELLDLLDTDGPGELIRRTRDAELAETDAERATRRGTKVSRSCTTSPTNAWSRVNA